MLLLLDILAVVAAVVVVAAVAVVETAAADAAAFVGGPGIDDLTFGISAKRAFHDLFTPFRYSRHPNELPGSRPGNSPCLTKQGGFVLLRPLYMAYTGSVKKSMYNFPCFS